jgi:hypothetical protein
MLDAADDVALDRSLGALLGLAIGDTAALARAAARTRAHRGAGTAPPSRRGTGGMMCGGDKLELL